MRPLLAALLAFSLLAPLQAAAQPSSVPGSSAPSPDGGGADREEETSGEGSEGPSEYYFRIDRLNAGLGRAPGSLDRETPQASLESFLFAARGDRPERAAHVLDLSDLEPARQRARGAALADKLRQVIDRKVWIDWASVTDRPDGLNEYASTKSPVGGDPRRSVRLERLDLGDRTVSIRMNRVKPQGGEPVWVFSRQTVALVEPLYERYGPTPLERALPAALKRDAFDGVPWWELIALPAHRAALDRRRLGRLPRPRRAQRARARRATRRGARARARAPAALFVAAFAARRLAGEFLVFSASINTFLNPILIGLIILSAIFAIVRVIDAILDVLERREIGDQNIDDEQNTELRHRYTNLYAARRIAVFIAVIVGLGVILIQTNIFSALGISILASAGVLSIIIGLAAQTVLGNILSSLQIAIAKPINIGDSVNYEGDWAYVEAINYTFVELRTWDLRRLIVPVKYFVSNPFENWSKTEPRMVKPVVLRLDHDADVDALRKHWAEIARADEDVDGEDWIKTLVIGHDDEGISVRFYCSAKDPTTAWNMHCRLREKMLAYVSEREDYWPRERVVDLSEGASAASAAASVA